MSVTASPARVTADSAAATNDRSAGYRRNSDVCDRNTRRGGGRSRDMRTAFQLHRSTAPLTARQAGTGAATLDARGSVLDGPPRAFRAAAR